ncbi:MULTISPECIES: transposase [Emticicia]|uniref:transposase n=1 Tax=Emticicia TaxID=312278 RepID=UPI0012E88900|nr:MULTISPECIES: transposase [Emticicia]
MAVKVRQSQRATIYFITFTCHKWLPLFEETKLYDNIYCWFKILQEQGIKTVGYVLMPNHLHCMLYLPKEAPELYKIISNAKRFMAYEIVKRLEHAGNTTLLTKLEEGVKVKEGKKGKLHQVFKESYDAKECFNQNFIIQKLDYMHKNPVSGKWYLASDYLQYKHSSARFYDLNEINELVFLTHYQDV